MTNSQTGDHWDADDYADQEERKCKDCGNWNCNDEHGDDPAEVEAWRRDWRLGRDVL